MSRFDDFISESAPKAHEQNIKSHVTSALEDNKKLSRRKWLLTWWYPLLATTASVGVFFFEYQRQRKIQESTPGIDLSLIDFSAEELISLSEAELDLLDEMDILQDWEEDIGESG